MRFVWPLALAIMLVAPATARTQSFDMAKLDCRRFTDLPRSDRSALMFWMAGVAGARDGDPVIDDRIEQVMRRTEHYCVSDRSALAQDGFAAARSGRSFSFQLDIGGSAYTLRGDLGDGSLALLCLAGPPRASLGLYFEALEPEADYEAGTKVEVTIGNEATPGESITMTAGRAGHLGPPPQADDQAMDRLIRRLAAPVLSARDHVLVRLGPREHRIPATTLAAALARMPRECTGS
ncbi:HdeA/HdeB family chaperone [Phreatobacter stygius]|nr:HdeA/HdeB family chaperone [Phreatobacter stygius]